MPDFIEQLRRQLVELGCPRAHVRRLVREVADHREDLKQAAQSEGLSAADAEARENSQLGDPLALAEHLMAALRRSVWCGRHSVIAFCLLPILVYPVLWTMLLLLQMALAFALGFGGDMKKLHMALNNPVTFHHLTTVFQCMDYVAIALVALFLCWLARRSAVSLKWMVTACSVVAVITWGKVEPHSFSLGFSANSHLHMPWIRGAIPLLVAGASYAFQRRTTRQLRMSE